MTSAQARYDASPKGIARRKRYEATAKARARKRRYEEKHPERRERWSAGMLSYSRRAA